MTPRQRARQSAVRAAEKRGEPMVSVVAYPLGPHCTVLTPEGVIVHGYRVHDDHKGCQSEVVTRGWCVEAVAVDGKFGHALCDTTTDRELIVNAEDSKIRGALSRAETIRIRIRATDPPTLNPRS